MPGSAGSCPVATAVRAAAQVPSPRSRPGWPSTPGAVTRASRAAQRMVTGREDGRTPTRPALALPASSVPPWGRPSNRSSGRPASRGVRCPGVQVSGASKASGASGVRTDRPPVSAALPPRCPRRAGPWSGSVWRPSPVGLRVVDVPRGPRAAWSPACIGPDGKGWRGVGRAWLARGSTIAQGRRLAGVPAAAPSGRNGAGPGPGCRPGGGGAWDEQVLTGPRRASWAGRRRGARPKAWTRRW